MGWDAGEVVHPAGGDERADDDDRSGADAGNELGRHARREHDAGGDGEIGRAAPDRGVAEDVLHVEGQEEEHRQEAGEGKQLGGVRGRESLDPQDREREQRVADPALVGGEGGQ